MIIWKNRLSAIDEQASDRYVDIDQAFKLKTISILICMYSIGTRSVKPPRAGQVRRRYMLQPAPLRAELWHYN